jgi:uncharacterized LabA/DUF88 family protein
MAKIGIFIDVSNLYYCIANKFNQRKLDYSKYYKYIEDLGNIEIAIAYGAQIKNQASKFLYALNNIGFQTKYRSPKAFLDNGNVRKKADCDLQIAVDIIKNLNEIDLLILGSADGDFKPILELANNHNIKTIVIACKISGDLKEVADEFIEIPESLLEEK